MNVHISWPDETFSPTASDEVFNNLLLWLHDWLYTAVGVAHVDVSFEDGNGA
jgi:hypothetical protein